jgi:hypothetical protein
MRKAGTLAALFEATNRTLSAVTGEDARGSFRHRGSRPPRAYSLVLFHPSG